MKTPYIHGQRSHLYHWLPQLRGLAPEEQPAEYIRWAVLVFVTIHRFAVAALLECIFLEKFGDKFIHQVLRNRF